MTVVYHDGLVKWVPGLTTYFSCDFNMYHFPFDEQICQLNFMPNTYDVNKVQFETFDGSITLKSYIKNGGWTLNASIHVRNATFANFGVGSITFSDLVVTLYLTRR